MRQERPKYTLCPGSEKPPEGDTFVEGKSVKGYCSIRGCLEPQRLRKDGTLRKHVAHVAYVNV